MTCAVATPSLSVVAASSKAATVSGSTVTVATAADNEYQVQADFTLELIGAAGSASTPFDTFDKAGLTLLTRSDGTATVDASAAGTWEVDGSNKKQWKLVVAAAKAGQHTFTLPAVANVYSASAALTVSHGA